MQPASRPSFIERLSVTCNHYTEHLLLFLGLGMTVIVITQVFCRYILNHSLFWSEELARYLLVWLTFLGASVAYRRRLHPSVDMFYKRVSPPYRRVLRLAVQTLSLMFFTIMIWYGCRFAYFVRLQITPALSLPKWIIFAVIPISGIILALHTAAFIWHDIEKRKDK